MANIPTVSWDESNPAGSQDISLGDDRIRELKTQIREVINVDHDFPSSGQAADNGQHKQVTLQEQADLGTGAVGATILGSQTSGGKGELTYTDEDDNDIQITKGGALYLGDARLDNDAYLLAIDNAGTGTVNVIKVDTSDEIVLGAVTTLPDTSKLATSAAPTADAEIANKKYVDDEVGAIKTIAQVVYTSYTATTSGTGSIPFDDTKPQNTEGFQISGLSTSITPKSAMSKLLIEVVVQCVPSTPAHIVVALFKDTDADAIAAGKVVTISYDSLINFKCYITSGTTSAITFSVRAGLDAGTLYINGNAGGRYFDGVAVSSVKITEIYT